MKGEQGPSYVFSIVAALLYDPKICCLGNEMHTRSNISIDQAPLLHFVVLAGVFNFLWF